MPVTWPARGLAGEGEVVALLSQTLFDAFVFCLPPGEQFLAYPVAGPSNDLRPQHRSWNIVWYRPAEEASELRRTSDRRCRSYRHELSIPPPLIRPPVIAAMREAARRLLPPQLAAVMERLEQPFLQPIYDLESPVMAFGQVALIGDAAFLDPSARRRWHRQGGCGRGRARRGARSPARGIASALAALPPSVGPWAANSSPKRSPARLLS